MTKLTRRSLLTAGVALTIEGRVDAAAGHAEPGVRFGLRTPFADRDLRKRALFLRRLGYDGIELGPEYLDQPAREIQAQLTGTGIVVSAIVGSLQLLDPDPEVRRQAVELDRRRLSLARELGAAGVIEVPMFGPCKFPEWARDPAPHQREDALLIEALAALAPDIKRTGVKLLLEPLTKKETHFMNQQEHGARLIETLHAPGLHLLSDFYHMQLEEQDIGQTLGRVGKHTAYVHLADGRQRTEPGSLPFDYRPGFRQLKKKGFAGWLTMECGATDNAEAAMTRALQYIKRQWRQA